MTRKYVTVHKKWGKLLSSPYLVSSIIISVFLCLSTILVEHGATANCFNPPTASTGPSQEVNAGSKVKLDGSESSGCAALPLYYTWKKIDGPPVDLKGTHKAVATFVAPDVSQATKLTFELSVKYDISNVKIDDSTTNSSSSGTSTNGIDTSSSAEIVDVLVKPIIRAPTGSVPVANAGNGGSYDETTKDIPLDGSKSSDLDGDKLLYKWKKVSGPKVAIDDSTAAVTNFNPPSVTKDTLLRFTLKVSDKDGSDTSTVDFQILNTKKVAGPTGHTRGGGQIHPGGVPDPGGRTDPVFFNKPDDTKNQPGFGPQTDGNNPPWSLIAIAAVAIPVIIGIAIKKSGKRSRHSSIKVVMKGGLSA